MRKLMCISIGFCAACLISAYWLSGGAVLILAGVCLVLAAAALWIIKKPAAAVALLGCSIGLVYFWCFDHTVLSEIKALDGDTEYIQMEATGYSFDTGYSDAVDGKIRLAGKNYSVRLFFQDETSVSPGDIICGAVRFRYTPEGGMKNTTYHKGEGIFLLAYAVDKMGIEPADHLAIKYYPVLFRKTIARRITDIFPAETAAFAKALLLGDDSQITFMDNIAFQKSGIRHVIAVSGLHISIIFSAVYFFIGKRKYLTLAVGLPILALFAAMAGFTPSVVRACLMQAMMLLSIAVDKEYDPPTALSFSVLVMLIVNPLTVTSVSFQLSVGSMIGIFAFSQPILRYLRDEKRFGKMAGNSLKARLKRWITGSVSVTVSAMTVTLPLCALYFGMVSVAGILTNLLTLWVISFIFCGIMAACFLSVFWLPLGSMAAYVVSVPIFYVLYTARYLSQIPFGVAYTDSPYTVLWVVCTGILIVLFLRTRKRSAALLTASVVFLYALSLTLTWVEPQLDPVRMTVMDVGQGQCILLQSKDASYLIDCGGQDPERTAEKALCVIGSQGIQELDGVILTHFDTDHANGASYLAQVMPVKRLYIPSEDPHNDICVQLESGFSDICKVEQAQTLPCGTGELTIYPGKIGTDSNESSMCILFRGENCDILITGDRDVAGEKYLLEQGDIPQVDVLVVGHHGAATSTGLQLLEAVKPKLAVISVGEDNIHGHPSKEALKRLQRAGCIIKRTDIEGTIIIRG